MKKIQRRSIYNLILSFTLIFTLITGCTGCGSGTAAQSSEAEAASESREETALRGGFLDRLNQASREAQVNQAGQAGTFVVSNDVTNEILTETGTSTLSTDSGEKRSVTVMVYMNGSDLESEGACASDDLTEMLSSGIGTNVNVVIQTMGTKKWHKYGISANTAQTYHIKDGKLELVRDNLGQLSPTSEDTLADFITYCKGAFPAERNIFLFWDHGGGPVYGFGVDEWKDEEYGLSLSEMARAFTKGGVHFDMIGMDCCIMASLETCYALSPYCNYALLSEDFESGLGWSYKDWMAELEQYPGITIPLLGKKIIDTIISSNESDPEGASSSMSLFNETTAVNLYNAWKAYAYKNQDAFFKKNYSRMHKSKGRGSFTHPGPGGFGQGDHYDYEGDYGYNAVTLDQYYLTDLLALIESVDNSSEEAKTLTGALKAAVAYFGHTSDKNELTGMSVSLPYGDNEIYKIIQDSYKDINFDSEYIEWLENFVSSTPDYYGYEGFEQSWGGWGAYEHDFGFNSDTGQCGDCAYDYSSGYFSGNEDSFLSENWLYDYENELWYLIDGDEMFFYDDKAGINYYYDDVNDQVYYYDDRANDWVLAE